MRSSDQEIIEFLNQLIQAGNEIVSELDKARKKTLVEDYLKQLKQLIEWPHFKQINPLITMKIKNIETAPFIAYLNDLPITKHTFGIFKNSVSNSEVYINQQIKNIELGLEAIKYFYKNK